MADQGMKAAQEQGERLQKRLFAIGVCVQVQRARKRLSIESISAEAQLGHVTWRRVEDGKKVRTSTYAALDEYFGLPAGMSERAMISDENAVYFANAMGVGIMENEHEHLPPDEFVDQLARSHRIGAVKYGGLHVKSGGAVSGLQAAGRLTVNPMGVAVDRASQPAEDETITHETSALVQRIGEDGQRYWVRTTSPLVFRLEKVMGLAKDLAIDPDRSDLGEEVRQMLVKYTEELVVDVRQETGGLQYQPQPGDQPAGPHRPAP